MGTENVLFLWRADMKMCLRRSLQARQETGNVKVQNKIQGKCILPHVTEHAAIFAPFCRKKEDKKWWDHSVKFPSFDAAVIKIFARVCV